MPEVDVRSESPEALLVRVGAGDRAAFAELYRTFGPRIKGFALERLEDPVAAEELTHDVLLTLWRKADRYDPDRAAATTWVFTIARNRLIDRVRRRCRPEPDPDDPQWIPSAPPAADQVVHAEQRSERVRRALESLPEAQRQVLVLTFYEARTYPEIAEHLQIALGTVKSRARLGFTRLRSLLEAAR